MEQFTVLARRPKESFSATAAPGLTIALAHASTFNRICHMGVVRLGRFGKPWGGCWACSYAHHSSVPHVEDGPNN